MAQLTTTLDRINFISKEKEKNNYAKYIELQLMNYLKKSEIDNSLLSFIEILEVVGLKSALWCAKAERKYHIAWRKLAIEFIEQAELDSLMHTKSFQALKITKTYIRDILMSSEMLHKAHLNAKQVTNEINLNIKNCEINKNIALLAEYVTHPEISQVLYIIAELIQKILNDIVINTAVYNKDKTEILKQLRKANNIEHLQIKAFLKTVGKYSCT